MLIPPTQAFAAQENLEQNEPPGHLAILDFEAKGGIRKDEASIITERFRAKLLRTGRYKIMDRAKMTEILKEQAFQQSGLCDSTACSVEIGRLLSVNRILTGSVSKLDNLYTLTARIMDVEKGNILVEEYVDCTCRLGQLLTEATETLVNKLVLPNKQRSDLPVLEQPLTSIQSSTPTITPQPSNSPQITMNPSTDISMENSVTQPSHTPTPSATPMPDPHELPVSDGILKSLSLSQERPPLDNRILLSGNYFFRFDEQVPLSISTELKMPESEQGLSGDYDGISAQLNGRLWFGEPYTTFGNLGLDLNLSTSGGYSYFSVNSYENPPQIYADMKEIFWGNLAVLYKIVSNPRIDWALGLEGYFRYTDSSNDSRNHYFVASRSYTGIGVRSSLAWRLIDTLSLEAHIAPHFVSQDLPNLKLNALPINRFDTHIQLLLNWNFPNSWNISGFDLSKLSLNAGYQGLFLYDFGSAGQQNLHGLIFGIGYHF